MLRCPISRPILLHAAKTTTALLDRPAGILEPTCLPGSAGYASAFSAYLFATRRLSNPNRCSVFRRKYHSGSIVSRATNQPHPQQIQPRHDDKAPALCLTPVEQKPCKLLRFVPAAADPAITDAKLPLRAHRRPPGALAGATKGVSGSRRCRVATKQLRDTRRQRPTTFLWTPSPA